MCGIIGIVSAVNTKPKTPTASYLFRADDFIQQGLVVASLRGMDSTGLFQIDPEGAPYLYKSPNQASIFIQDKTAKGFITAAPRAAMTVCHVRAATEGRVSVSNAHPFQAWDKRNDDSLLIGVHNGTLQNWKSHPDAPEYDVDSEWAMHMIANEGYDAFTDHFKGAYSFVWWDSKNPMRLWFARNADRPMSVVRTKNKKHIMFASEPDMLALLTGRNNIEVEETVYVTGTHQVYYVDVDRDELIIEPFGTKFVEPTSGWGFGRPLPASSGVGSNVTSIHNRTNDSRYAADSNGFFSRLDAWFAGIEAARGTKNNEFSPPGKKDSDAPATKNDAYAVAQDNLFITEVPIDYAELPKAEQDEYYTDLVDTAEALEAHARGLSGTLVLFEAADEFTTDGHVGSIVVVPCDNHPAYDTVDAMGAEAIYLSTGENFNPTKTMYKNKKVMGVIAGVKETDATEGPIYMLSPLRANGWMRLKEHIDLYLATTGHSVKVPSSSNVH